MKSILDLEKSNFTFTEKDNLRKEFSLHNLLDGKIEDLNSERGVLIQNGESNNYLRLFYRIRNGLAHGKFCLRLSSNLEKMIVIQDDDSHNVTARIVIKLSTFLSFINTIDKAHLL